MNNINAITDNHRDNRLECELNHHGYPLQVCIIYKVIVKVYYTYENFFILIFVPYFQDDDTISQKSYGSHKIRSFKDESHKGSADTIDGEEKKDASKEELGLEEG